MPTKTTTKKATPVKKTTTKKVNVTKKVPATITEFKALVCASSGECFWTRDGRILQNLEDLHMAFGSMGEEVFVHHVNDEKNDFADWVEQVLHDLDCAVALRKTKELTKTKTVVGTHLKKYSKT